MADEYDNYFEKIIELLYEIKQELKNLRKDIHDLPSELPRPE